MGEYVNIILLSNKVPAYFKIWVEHCILAVTFFLPISLNLASAFLVIGVLLWLMRMLMLGRIQFRRTPFDFLIGLLVLLGAISILGSPDRGFSFYNYYHLMGRYILLYYLIVNNMNSSIQLRKMLIAIISSALVVAAYGFYQYLYGVSVALEWVDVEQFPDLRIRVFSTLKNPNLLAAFLVTVMSLCAGIALKMPNVIRKTLLFSIVGILGVCLVLTYSRGAWISLLAVIGAYGFLHNRKILWLLLFIPVVVFFYAHDSLMGRILSIFNPTDTSSTLRMALWESTIAMIIDKPLFGIGWGAYYLVYPEYDFFINDGNIKIFHAHNMYLNIAAEIGIPGLLVFLMIMYGHIKAAWHVLTMTHDKYIKGAMAGIIAAIAGLLVSGFTDYVMFSIQLSMLYWLLSSMVIAVYPQQVRVDTKLDYIKKM